VDCNIGIQNANWHDMQLTERIHRTRFGHLPLPIAWLSTMATIVAFSTHLAVAEPKYAVTANGELSKADGFRGIWYANQPSHDEYAYKYSGGMATYPQQQMPIAIYAPDVNKTFFVYGGRYRDQNSLLHMVSYYDHATGKLARPRVLLDKLTDDAHDNPTLCIDADGFISVFSASHGTSRPSYIHRSLRPYDISAFRLIRTTNFSYAQPWFLPEHKFVFLHTKYAGGRELFVELSNDGADWSQGAQLARFGEGHYQVSCTHAETIGTAFDYHPTNHSKGEPGLNYRTNLYFMESADGGQTWANVQGERLELPLSQANNPALAIDYEARGLLCYIKCVRYLHDGRPAVLLLTSKGYASGPRNDPRTMSVAVWTGQKWTTNYVTTFDNNYDYAFLDILSDGTWQILGAIDPGPQLYNPGGEIVIWRSHDDGKTWRKFREVTKASKLNANFPRLPVNARPDFYALWADGDARKPSDSALYYCNQNGTKVFQLPTEITGTAELVDPIQVIQQQ
jgi:hypothetical protein